MRRWLLEHSAKEAIDSAIGKSDIDQEAKYLASVANSSSSMPRNMQISGDTAVISVKGVLTDAPDFGAFLFGGGNTTYPDIIKATMLAEANPKVTKKKYHIDSPGGEASALWIEAMDVIFNSSKPSEAIVGNMAASAAYGIAAQTNEITAYNRMSSVGSIGVVISLKKEDEDRVEIASSNAPNKRPDVKTAEGLEVVQHVADASEKIMIDTIARGMGVSPEKVKKDFGQGGTVLAEEAIKKGMVSRILGEASINIKTGAKSMNTLEELKVSHPDLYASAVQLGVVQERDRASAHLIRGEASGCLSVAIKAVTEGAVMTEVIKAQYDAAAMKTVRLNALLGDNTSAAAADGVAPADTQTAESQGTEEEMKLKAHSAVMGIAAKKLGLKIEGAK